jgi:anti-anti-sigma factor
MLNVNPQNLGIVSLLKLDGNILIGETDSLRDVVPTMPSSGSVILDLSRVTMVDAHGLGVLLQLREQATARDMKFELMNISPQLREILIFPQLVANARRARVAGLVNRSNKFTLFSRIRQTATG